MTFTEIEKIASVAGVMPHGLHCADYACYQGLCNLYHRYRTGQIDHAQALLEKKQFQEAHARDSISQRAYDDSLKRERAVRGLSLEIQRNGTEREKLLVAVLDGRAPARQYINIDCVQEVIQ